MRSVSTLLALFAFTAIATAADPKSDQKPDANKSGNQYAVALQKTAALLAKVTDEATAADAKPKLDNLHEEARSARSQLFKALAEVEMRDNELAESMGVFWKNARQITDAITAEFDRIGTNKKAAYKVLRETKLFAELEKDYENRAKYGAETLMFSVRAYSARNSGNPPPKLEDLAAYSETGKEALADPWGFPYQLLSKPGKDGVTRTYIWTVSPYTGKKLGQPPPDEK